MPKSLLAIVLAAFALWPGAAAAADVFARNAGTVSWQGLYVGVNGGAQWGSVSNSVVRAAGAAGGVQAGYSVQKDRFVFGIETDLQLAGADGTFAAWKFSNPWFGTLRGRVGWALDNVLLYGTLGLAYGTLRAQSAPTSVSEWKASVGWTAGAGVEVAMLRHWSARAEYLYVDLNDRPYLLTGARHGIDSSLLRVGLNYRF